MSFRKIPVLSGDVCVRILKIMAGALYER